MNTDKKQSYDDYLESMTTKAWDDYISSRDSGDSAKLINKYRLMYLDAHLYAQNH